MKIKNTFNSLLLFATFNLFNFSAFAGDGIWDGQGPEPEIYIVSSETTEEQKPKEKIDNKKFNQVLLQENNRSSGQFSLSNRPKPNFSFNFDTQNPTRDFDNKEIVNNDEDHMDIEKRSKDSY